jgi:hypothetical protein
MANEITGALQQVQPPQPVNAQQPVQPSPLQQAPQAAPSNQDLLSDYFQKVKQQDTAATQALNERRQRLLELTGARKQMFDPKMLRLSAALAKPTVTGSFGESLGNASAAMADEQEKEFARKQQELKLQMEIDQMMQTQGRQMLGQELAANIFKNRQAPTASGAPMSAQVASPPAVNAPAMPPVNGAPAAVAPAPVAPMPASPMPAAPAQTIGLPPRKPGSFDNLDDDQLFALGIATPDLAKAIETNKENQRKARETQIKEAEFELKGQSVKGMIPGVGANEMPVDFWNKLRSANSMDEVKSLYTKYNLPWNVTKEKDGTQRFMTPNELTQQSEEGKAKLNEKLDKYTIPELGRGQYELLPSEYREYRKAKAEGKDALQQWFNSSHPEFGVTIPGAKKVKATGEATGVESTGTRESREKGEAKFSEESAKSAAEKAQGIIAAGDTARDRELLSDDLYKMASNPKYKKAFAILEKATPESALGKLISEGVSVGNFKVSIPQLRDVVVQSGGNEQDVEAFRRLGNIYTQLMFTNGNLMKGEGAISNYERQLQVEMAGSVADTPKIAMARAEYLKMRANFDRQASNMYQRWMEANPNKSYNQFKLDNPQYSTLEKNYIDKVKAIGNKYYPNLATGEDAAPRRAAPTGGRQLPAGSSVNTEVWEIDANGKPRKVK